jgi:hypothetical protein
VQTAWEYHHKGTWEVPWESAGSALDNARGTCVRKDEAAYQHSSADRAHTWSLMGLARDRPLRWDPRNRIMCAYYTAVAVTLGVQEAVGPIVGTTSAGPSQGSKYGHIHRNYTIASPTPPVAMSASEQIPGKEFFGFSLVAQDPSVSHSFDSQRSVPGQQERHRTPA